VIEHVIVTYTEQVQRFIVIGAEMKRSRGGAEYSVFSRCRVIQGRFRAGPKVQRCSRGAHMEVLRCCGGPEVQQR